MLERRAPSGRRARGRPASPAAPSRQERQARRTAARRHSSSPAQPSASTPSSSPRAACPRRRTRSRSISKTADGQGLQGRRQGRRSGRRAGASLHVVGIASSASVDSRRRRGRDRHAAARPRRSPAAPASSTTIVVAADPGVARAARAPASRDVAAADVDVRTGAEQAAKQSEGHQRTTSASCDRAARLRRDRAVRRRVHHLQHLLDHGRPAHARVRAAATLGATRRQVLRSVIGEALCSASSRPRSACSAGLGCRSGSARLIKASASTCRRTASVIATRTIVVSLVVGTVVTLVPASSPALRATRVPPVAALREGAACRAAAPRRLAPLDRRSSPSAGSRCCSRPVRQRRRQPRRARRRRRRGRLLGVALLSPPLVRPLASLVGGPSSACAASAAAGTRERHAQTRPHGGDRRRADDRRHARRVRLDLRRRARSRSSTRPSTRLKGELIVSTPTASRRCPPAAAVDAAGRRCGPRVPLREAKVAGRRRAVWSPGSTRGRSRTSDSLLEARAGERRSRALGADAAVVDKSYAKDHGVDVGERLALHDADRRRGR